MTEAEIHKKESTKEWKEYNEIYRNIFHLLGFKDEHRELCAKLTLQSIKEIIRTKKNKIDYKKVLKQPYQH